MHERKLREREDKAMKTKSRGTGNNSNDPNHKKMTLHHCKTAPRGEQPTIAGRRLHQLGIGYVVVTTAVRNVGNYAIFMTVQVTRAVSACFAVLRQLRSIRQLVSPCSSVASGFLGSVTTWLRLEPLAAAVSRYKPP